VSNTNEVTVYPVPAKDRLNIQFVSKDENKVEVAVVNTMGSTLLRQSWIVSAGMQNQNLDVSRLPNGVYFISISNGKSIQTKKEQTENFIQPHV
jgi:hypothetical protein